MLTLKYEGNYYNINSPVKPRGYKEPYLLKWIRKNDIEQFKLGQFFKKYPKRLEKRNEVIDLISSEIKAKRMVQLSSNKDVLEDEFKVIKS